MSDLKVNRLKRLYQFGQSPWYDNIDRRLIENGELKSLFDKGIKGVTSNPSIFENAVKSSSVYDEKIKHLKKEGMSIEEICDELTADDVRDAADLLKGVYEDTKGMDGYVSVEVPPSCAHDSLKTIEYARYIFKKVGRKNILIKVPGTKESPPVIRTLIREGINVNVTLLFSISQYEPIASAYQEGLRERMNSGLEIDTVVSVASVFVSRIDSKIDPLLDVFSQREQDLQAKREIDSIKGKIAISNTKLLYQRFKELFNEKKFSDLKLRGAKLQRPLWASTSTKNSLYSDVLYVDNLIGPFTINTMPHQTVLAFVDHGHIALTLESELEWARDYLFQLQKLNIDLEAICTDAQREGIAAFQKSYDRLLNAIAIKAG